MRLRWLILVASLAQSAWAASPIKAVWDDGNPAGRVAQYRVLIGTNFGVYLRTNTFTVLPESTPSVTNTLINLFVGRTNYLVVEAVGVDGQVSDPSNETSVYVIAPPTMRAVIILQAAADVGGPWGEQASFQVDLGVVEAQQFYRARVALDGK